MEARLRRSSAAGQIILLLLVIANLTGCTKQKVRTNPAPLRATPLPQTIQVMASSSLRGRPMGDDSVLLDKVAKAFQKQFPGARLVQSEPEMVVIFTMVDYVPGCLPDCKKFRTYRNWSCEVLIYPREPGSDTMVFNLDGTSYNPFYNQGSRCAAQLASVTQNSKSKLSSVSK
jgi:hypothetical protein